jgi:hypothetical protein
MNTWTDYCIGFPVSGIRIFVLPYQCFLSSVETERKQMLNGMVTWSNMRRLWGKLKRTSYEQNNKYIRRKERTQWMNGRMNGWTNEWMKIDIENILMINWW